jgi:hypothetical protein
VGFFGWKVSPPILLLSKEKCVAPKPTLLKPTAVMCQLKYQAPLGDIIKQVSQQVDNNQNDRYDTQILNEVFENRVDILISEDKKIHTKAKLLGIADRVFRIQTFLEKSTAENPELVIHKVLAVKRVDFAEVDLKDSFFDSFRSDYAEFDKWFNSKSEQPCYVCYSDNQLTAFLFIKIEKPGEETYSEINPIFKPKKRLKIGTLLNLIKFAI